MTPNRSASRAACILVMSVCACSNPANPAAPGSPPAAVDLKSSLSASFDALTIPANAACSISISQHGLVVFERGRGQVAPGLPASADSLYRIASLTKPITASAILVSEQAGRLLRSDKVNRFLAYPEPAPTIDELRSTFPACRITLLRRLSRPDVPLPPPWKASCRSSSPGTAFGDTSTATSITSFWARYFSR